MQKYTRVFLVAAVALLLDQATKWYVRHAVELYAAIPVIDGFFTITHVRNTGGAFSLFAAAHPAFRLPFFVGVTVVAIGVIVYFVSQADPRHRLLLFALGLILGGAVGNLIDRVVAGQVTDFLDFHWRGYAWPAFNVADACITVGVLILLAHSVHVGDEHRS